MSMARLTVTIPEELEQNVRSRQGDRPFSSQLAHDLAWYYEIIKSGERDIQEKFTDKELDLVLEATKGFSWEPVMLETLVRGLFHDLIKVYCDGLGPSAERKELLEKYRALTPFQRLAIIDWVTRQRTHGQRDAIPESQTADSDLKPARKASKKSKK